MSYSLFSRNSMLKFELNFILQVVSYEVIMPRNIFLDNFPPLCPHMGFFISPPVFTLLNHYGVVERKNRHLVKTACTLLLYHKVL